MEDEKRELEIGKCRFLSLVAIIACCVAALIFLESMPSYLLFVMFPYFSIGCLKQSYKLEFDKEGLTGNSLSMFGLNVGYGITIPLTPIDPKSLTTVKANIGTFKSWFRSGRIEQKKHEGVIVAPSIAVCYPYYKPSELKAFIDALIFAVEKKSGQAGHGC